MSLEAWRVSRSRGIDVYAFSNVHDGLHSCMIETDDTICDVGII